MSETLERLYEREKRLLDIIHSAKIVTSTMPTSTIVRNHSARRDAEKELLQVQALIDAAQA